ncbi:MAG: hypothetical protein Q8830_03390 [Candidatus Phytoplasma australasiaticum]|nr:hypothetical protein [Candidatus Phytoplasma australasiaticum]
MQQVVLVASILTGYDIDSVHLIAEQIHESTLKRTTYKSFPILIHRLCVEMKVEVLLQLDLLLVALYTIDLSLLNADDNLVALYQAKPPMPKKFILEPQTEDSTTVATSTPAATTNEEGPQKPATVDTEIGPITTMSAPELSTS